MPAKSARMGVFDAVHTRMGASDNLAMGRSTFLEARAASKAGLLHQLVLVTCLTQVQRLGCVQTHE